MHRRLFPLTLCALAWACADEDDPHTGPTEPQYVELYPADGDTISVGERVQAFIDREHGDACRFSMETTTLRVTRDGVEVPGSLVFFVGGLRVDFTPSGLFEFGATYEAEVSVDCDVTAESRFSTTAAPETRPAVAPGDAVRIVDLVISEPQAIAPILRGFLDEASLIVKVMDFDDTSLHMLGAEGRIVDDPAVTDPDLRTFAPSAFLFPMQGTFKSPYFQIEGSLEIPVDVPGSTTAITLERFEISGMFAGDSPATELPVGTIRASSPCDDVCAVQDDNLQIVCANRGSICDEAGMLNLIGSFAGVPNDLRGFQSLTVEPAPGATDVPVDAALNVTLTRAVNVSSAGAVMFQLFDAGGELLPGGEPVVAADGLSATFTPDALLTPGSTYTALVVALDALEWQFTTAQ